MATIKSYTDLEQSKKLAEILPLETADMGYLWNGTSFCDYPVSNQTIFKRVENVPCWSLSALLTVLPNYQLQTQDDGIGILCSCNGKFNIVTADSPVDACVEMIIKLNEQKQKLS